MADELDRDVACARASRDASELLAERDDLRDRLDARTEEWKQALCERDEAKAQARKWRSLCPVSSEHCRELSVTPATVVSWLMLAGWTDLGVDNCGWHVWQDLDGAHVDVWRRPSGSEPEDTFFRRAASAIVYISAHLERPEHDVLDEIAMVGNATASDK